MSTKGKKGSKRGKDAKGKGKVSKKVIAEVTEKDGLAATATPVEDVADAGAPIVGGIDRTGTDQNDGDVNDSAAEASGAGTGATDSGIDGADADDADASRNTADTGDASLNDNTAATATVITPTPAAPARADRPLRVVVVSESSLEQTNGVSGSVRHILRRFAQRGFDAHVIAPQPAPTDGQVDGFPVDEVTSWPIQNFNVAIPTKTTVIRAIKKMPRPDVIHVAAPISRLGHAALMAGEELGVPTVAIYQTDVAQYARRFAREAVDGVVDGVMPRPPQHSGWLRKVARNAGEAAEQIVADRIARMHNMATLTLAPTTQAQARLESFGVDQRLVRLWGRGVDSELFTPERIENEHAQALRHDWSHGGTVPVVGYVGRLAPEKRVERLAALDGLNMQLVIVGGGPVEAELRERLPHAVFTGMLHGAALADAYAALDVFVHTGTEETFGQTLQEAMASGLPVVAPAAGGPIDLVREGETGLLYGADDDDGLRADVELLLSDPALRRRMGAAGLKAVTPRTWPALVDELIGYYKLAIELHMAEGARA